MLLTRTTITKVKIAKKHVLTLSFERVTKDFAVADARRFYMYKGDLIIVNREVDGDTMANLT